MSAKLKYLIALLALLLLVAPVARATPKLVVEPFTVIEGEIQFVEGEEVIDAMTCFFAAPWGKHERLTWDSYITPHPDIRICIEARFGDHYGWHPGWSRVGCVPSTETSLRPQDLLTRVGPIAPIILFRAVAVREFLDQDCINGGSPEHYCLAESRSSPANVICGGRFLAWPTTSRRSGRCPR